MGILQVEARGANHSSDHRLFVNVLVEDADGRAVEGLTAKSFEVWQLASSFGTLAADLVQDLGDAFPELAGVYRLILQDWAPAEDGTFDFLVRVERDGDIGRALASVVKVGGQPA